MGRFNITIIGTGNVAWHLSNAFENAGHVIYEIYDREIGKARQFAKNTYQAIPTSQLNFSESPSNLFIIAVSDDTIETISKNIQLPAQSVVAHTSGTIALNKLGYVPTPHIGVFYPLQTLSKGKKVDMKHLPICIEGETKEAKKTLQKLANTISNGFLEVHLIDSIQRKSIHLAAVFACNFTNHLLTISKKMMESNQLDFQLLQPLIIETLNKSLEIGPEKAQTGPAIRNDLETMELQHQALQNDPKVAEIYRLISEHIMGFYD